MIIKADCPKCNESYDYDTKLYKCLTCSFKRIMDKCKCNDCKNKIELVNNYEPMDTKSD